MTFTFIHTGDWHIGKPFGRFDAEKAPLLRAARTTIVDRIAELARTQAAATVLVAGDVFDSPMIADALLRRLAARLEQYTDLQWHFLPGNHDPATHNGIWQRFQKIVSGTHIVIHHEARLHHLVDGVDLLVAPLHARAIAHDPTAWMAEDDHAGGAIRIGLAHGAVQGFGSAGEASVLIAPDRALSAKLDYLALGDWHGAKQVGPKAWYAGTPEPDQFPDNEPGFALSVRIDAGGTEPVVQRHALGQYRWIRHALSGDLLRELESLESQISSPATSSDNNDAGIALIRLQLTGSVSLADEIDVRARIDRLGDIAFHVEADFSELRIKLEDQAAGSFDDPLLLAVAARLSEAMADEGQMHQAQVAHAALLLLSRFVADQGDAA